MKQEIGLSPLLPDVLADKFFMGDLTERDAWDRYMDACEDMIRHTSIPEAP